MPTVEGSAGRPSGGVIELSIGSLATGGDGVGRAPDGRVVFVPLSAPGDRLRVRIIEERARFARGEIDALLEGGPDRVAPECPVFGDCGGCSWQHVRYAAQLEAKRAIVRDALARIARLERLPEIEFVASPRAYGYRSRARLLVAGGRVGFRRRRSHEVCPIARCPLLVPELDRALGALAADPPAVDGEWELALGEGGELRSASLADPARAARIELRAGAERFSASLGVFAQANALLLDPLWSTVVGAVGAGALALELFAGAGFFTLGLASRFERVVAVEGDPLAARDLARNVADRRVRVIEARVESWLAEPGLAPDAILLDPPRGGLGRGPSERLAALPARRIAYLSCDPATLARDLAAVVPHAFRVARVCGFDLFPQTPHVEALVVLDREG